MRTCSHTGQFTTDFVKDILRGLLQTDDPEVLMIYGDANQIWNVYVDKQPIRGFVLELKSVATHTVHSYLEAEGNLKKLERNKYFTTDIIDLTYAITGSKDSLFDEETPFTINYSKAIVAYSTASTNYAVVNPPVVSIAAFIVLKLYTLTKIYSGMITPVFSLDNFSRFELLIISVYLILLGVVMFLSPGVKPVFTTASNSEFDRKIKWKWKMRALIAILTVTCFFTT